MTTLVLVHGAWHGGWCWEKVVTRLRLAGHTVFAPTLTGLGERSHLLTRKTGLEVHVEDIAALLRFESLRDVVLVGHSYAGLVITGVAGREPGRIRRLVYLDAFVPDDGEAAFDLLPPQASAYLRDGARDHGDGWKIPVHPLDKLGVTDPDAMAWLSSRMVPHPLRSYEETISVKPIVATIPGEFIACTRWSPTFRSQAERAAQRQWLITELQADHEAMATSADELHSILASVE